MKTNLKNLVKEGIKKVPLLVQLASALLWVGTNTALPEKTAYLYAQKYNAPTAIVCNDYVSKEIPKYLQDLNKPLVEEDF